MAILDGDTLEAKGTTRWNFSNQHLKAADHFAKQLLDHETNHAGKGWEDHYELCSWYASAALILSFSAIEAAIDEAEDDLELPAELADAFCKLQTLEHAQMLLVSQNKATFERSSEPYQSINLLRVLRNALVHPKAEWDDEEKNNKKLGAKIVSAGLPRSPFHQNPQLAFPYGCMSGGISQWAATSARQFIREMQSRLGLRVRA